jgi:hypothetical protein
VIDRVRRAEDQQHPVRRRQRAEPVQDQIRLPQQIAQQAQTAG